MDEAAGRDRARSQSRLADPALYARDPAALREALGRRSPPAQAELAAAEEEWLRLEMLREEVEG